MFSLRHLTRLTPAIRCVASENVTRQSLIQGVIRLDFNVASRNYSHSRDKKKDHKGKHAPKVEINEHQLATAVNVEQLKNQMEKALSVMKDEFVKNLSLRSSTGAIETLKVNAEGKEYELQELGQIIRKNPKTIVINLIGFPQLIPQVLQTLAKSGMNLNPQQEGTTIFVPVPRITKEHRENLAKNAKTLFIKCRDSIKDVQNSYIKKVKNQTSISIDLNHQIQNQIIAMGDGFINEAEKLLHIKQNELMASMD